MLKEIALTAQFDRLKQDVIELEDYIAKVKQRGKTDLVGKLTRKREYLKNYITEKQHALQ